LLRITEVEFLKSAIKKTEYIDSLYSEIAFAGRSNVGKSSLINVLLGRKNIAKISSTPGKTRLINFFRIKFKIPEKNQSGYFYIVDLPGYGFARVSKMERNKWQTMIDTYFNNRLNLRGIILLVDIRHPADVKDRIMLQFLREKQIPFQVVATKADKIASTRRKKILKELATDLDLEKDKILAFSALERSGVSEILNWINNIIL